MSAVMRIAAVVVVVSTACTDDTANPEPPEPLLPVIEVDPGPLWSGGENGLPGELFRAEIRGDAVVLYEKNPSAASAGEVLVVDARTGETAWSLADREPLDGGNAERMDGSYDAPVIVGDQDDWLMVVDYQRESEGEDEDGLVGLSADRTELWITPPFQDSLADSLSLLTTADGEIAVSGITTDNTLVQLDDSDEFATVAVDVADGSIRWVSDGVWPQFVTGDVVLGQVGRFLRGPDDPGVTQLEPVPPTTVALKADTGESLWNLSDRYSASKVFLAAGDIAAVTVPTAPDRHPDVIIIDVASGEELANLGVSALSCRSDDVSVVACITDSPREGDRMRGVIATYDAEEGDTHYSRAFRQVPSITALWNGYIFAEGDNFVDGELIPRHFAVDRNGTVVADDLPGAVIAISDDYAVFQDEDGHYAVHSVSTE